MVREELEKEIEERVRYFHPADHEANVTKDVMKFVDLYVSDLCKENEELRNALITELREIRKLRMRIEELEKEIEQYKKGTVMFRPEPHFGVCPRCGNNSCNGVDCYYKENEGE